jgi:peptide/nickel transport system permease protein
VSATAPLPATAPAMRRAPVPRAGTRGLLRTLRRNPSFVLGALLILLLVGFALSGRLFVGWNDAFPLSAPPSMPPGDGWAFGTDADGRNLLAVIVYGTLLTLKIGVIAGCLGLGIGTTLAFVAAYHGGWLDVVLRLAVDVLITIPTLLVLVVIASVIHHAMNTTMMGIIIALLAWREPTRQIRSQVLVMREAPYVKLALLNGASSLAR